MGGAEEPQVLHRSNMKRRKTTGQEHAELRTYMLHCLKELPAVV